MYTFRHGVTESTQYLILAEISRQSAINVSNYVFLHCMPWCNTGLELNHF